jgi:hypothetical protein
MNDLLAELAAANELDLDVFLFYAYINKRSIFRELVASSSILSMCIIWMSKIWTLPLFSFIYVPGNFFPTPGTYIWSGTSLSHGGSIVDQNITAE